MKQKEIKEIEKEIQMSKDIKPLGNPIPNKFLLMIVKNYIKNRD